MIKVGIAGIGFMGWIHWLAYQRVAGIQVRAICEQNARRLAGDWTDIKGNFGPPGEQVDLAGIARYSQLDDLLADASVDAVDICLPPHLHADVAVKAFAAGKHVFCEKPLSLTPSDCQRVVEAAETAGKLLLVGHVLTLFPEYASARQVAQSGQYGKLLGGCFKRIISDPLWLPDFYDPHKTGGPLLDLLVHDTHFIRVLFGMPRAVYSQGRWRGDVVEYCQTAFLYDDPALVINQVGGVINQQGRSFTHGFELHLEGATLNFEAAVYADKFEILPLKLLTSDGRVERPPMGDGDPSLAFQAEIAEVARCLSTGQPSAVLDGRLARDAIVLAHKQAESVRQGRAMTV